MAKAAKTKKDKLDVASNNSNEPLNKLSTQSGLSAEYDRETFIVRKDLMDKIKDVAYWERQLLKETIEAAFITYLEEYEKKVGKLKSRPDEVKAREQLRSKSGRPKGSKNK